MKSINFTVITLILTILILSCKKDKTGLTDGKYSGTFTERYNNQTWTGPVTMELKNSGYICSRNMNHVPAGGSGTYSIDNNKIIFRDTNGWTCDFDGNLILNRSYDYSFDGTKLIISTIRQTTVHYEYVFEKTE